MAAGRNEIARSAVPDTIVIAQGYHDGWTGAFNTLDSDFARGAAA